MARLPLPPGFEPRGLGESRYQYQNRLSIARYGKTLYQRRIERGISLGKTVRESRGHAPTRIITGVPAGGGYVPPDYFPSEQDLNYYEAAANGYTTSATGLTYQQLGEVWPLIKQMNMWASPEGQMIPAIILDAVEAEQQGRLDDGWTYENIKLKYRAMYDYHMARIRAPYDIYQGGKKKYSKGSYMPDNVFGRMRFMRGRNNYQVPIMWWWYH